MADEGEFGGHHTGDQVIIVSMTDDGHTTHGSQSLGSENSSTINVDRRDEHEKKQLRPSLSANTLRKRATLRRLSFSKPKSRNIEFNFPPKINGGIDNEFDRDQTTIWEEEVSNNCNGLGDDSTSDFSSYSSESDEDEEVKEEEEQEENNNNISGKKYHKSKKKKTKIKWKRVAEWSIFLVILTCLILSFTVSKLRKYPMMGLRLWQWCLMVMVVFSGRLCSGWLVSFLVFLLERNIMLRDKVLYFVYGLRNSIQSVIWLGFVILAWTCMIDARVHHNNKVVKKVSQLLIAVLVGAIMWLVKIVMVKTLASSFHVRTYFDRMKESVFHHYILDALSGPPMDELIWHEQKSIVGSKSLPTKWKDAKNELRSKKYGSRNLDTDKLKELSVGAPASIWSLKRLMTHIRSSGLTTISKTVDEFGKAESEITSEWEARATAKRIFRNVAKRGAKYIEEEDLARFLKRIEIHAIFPLFEGAIETGRITKSAFRNWVVRAYFERKALANSLNDTKTAVQQLQKIASAIVSVIIFVVFLLQTGLATPKVVAFVTTQMVVLGVIFYNTCKNIFDCIVFVFVMHPFDVGDRCKVDDVPMYVEEMHILTTVFLRSYDMEKIYYPNLALLSKPISNFYRSPEMWDTIPFNIDAWTPIESINAFKKAIQGYIDSKPNHWYSKHIFIVSDIEDLNKMKMSLSVQHTINHHNINERNDRLTDLILELKKNFEIIGIKYHLLPQEVHLTKFNNKDPLTPTPTPTPS